MSDKQRIEGDMACQVGFLVLPECLDQSFESRTACFPLIVRLPRLDKSLHQVDLVAPFSKFRADDDAEDAKEARYPGDSKWGCLQPGQDNPDDWENPIPRCAVVERLRFVTEAAADGSDLHDILDHFGTDQMDWWTRLADWIGVVSSQDLVGLGRNRHTASFERISMWTDGRESGLTKLGFGDLRPYCGEPLKRDELARCMALVAEDTRPPDEWLLIRDARSLVRADEYRRAVLDAGTAAELAITAMLDNHLLANSSPEVAAALMERTRMLGNRYRLANDLLSGALPDQVNERVIEPRNKAAHHGAALTKEVANAAVETATALVDAAYPLSHFGLHAETANPTT